MKPDHLRKRIFPPYARPLTFGVAEQQDAYDRFGANCGPGALAALLGVTPHEIVPLLGPEFQRLGGTTEVMIEEILTRSGLDWGRPAAPCWPDLGIVRIQWDGPWIGDPDPIEKLRHSHWVLASTRGLPHVMIFDINAISAGGWLSLREWSDDLVPWLLDLAEPDAYGEWWISDTLALKRAALDALPGFDPQCLKSEDLARGSHDRNPDSRSTLARLPR